MKKYLLALAGILAFTVVFSGCDKLNLGFAKPKSSALAPAQAVTVKGTVIAKVNNIPITLEDMNQEIEAYNAEADKQNQANLKITTRDKKIAYVKDQMVRRALLYQEALDRALTAETKYSRSSVRPRSSSCLWN